LNFHQVNEVGRFQFNELLKQHLPIKEDFEFEFDEVECRLAGYHQVLLDQIWRCKTPSRLKRLLSTKIAKSPF
jgi:hypothetical protein